MSMKKNEVNQEKSARLAKTLDKIGLSDRKIANRVGISSAAISNLRNGKSNAGEQTLLLLHHCFGVNLNFIETGQEPMFLWTTGANGTVQAQVDIHCPDVHDFVVDKEGARIAEEKKEEIATIERINDLKDQIEDLKKQRDHWQAIAERMISVVAAPAQQEQQERKQQDWNKKTAVSA